MASLSRKFWISIAAIVGILLILLARVGLSSPSNVPKLPSAQSQAEPKSTQSDKVEILTTSPDPLNESTVTPTQTIQITFSQPAQNVPELKVRIEPVIDLNLQLSDDRKTLKISPKQSFGLQQGYSITIPADAKFDGGRTLGTDLLFHFKTISYSGI